MSRGKFDSGHIRAIACQKRQPGPRDCCQPRAGRAAGRVVGSSAAVCRSSGCGGGQARREYVQECDGRERCGFAGALWHRRADAPEQPGVVPNPHRGWIYGLGGGGRPEDAERRGLRAQGQRSARYGVEREHLSRTRRDGARAAIATAVGGASGTCAGSGEKHRALARGAACGWANGLGAARRYQRRFLCQ